MRQENDAGGNFPVENNFADESGLPAKTGREYLLLFKTVDEDTCNPLRLWHDMGEPSGLNERQKKLLQECARPFLSSERVRAEEGKLRVAFPVKEFGVVYFEIQPAGTKSDRGYDYDRVMRGGA